MSGSRRDFILLKKIIMHIWLKFEDFFHMLIKISEFNSNGRILVWNCRNVTNAVWKSSSITIDHLQKSLIKIDRDM